MWSSTNELAHAMESFLSPVFKASVLRGPASQAILASMPSGNAMGSSSLRSCCAGRGELALSLLPFISEALTATCGITVGYGQSRLFCAREYWQRRKATSFATHQLGCIGYKTYLCKLTSLQHINSKQTAPSAQVTTSHSIQLATVPISISQRHVYL